MRVDAVEPPTRHIQKYTGPDYNYGYPEWSKHTVTVTAFVDDKWYQSTYTVSICNEGC